MFARFRLSFKIDQKRFRAIYDEISNGSESKPRFYIMVAVSTIIACFGLITNSVAVVIGAMLVAPLMTPIFGMALALVRGDMHLLGRAARTEVVGVAAAIATGFILGLLIGDIEPSPEMLARTRPNLFDLLVAVFAGFAGAYALVDEKISPALPGVAIATALVPPLANSGLCLATGAVTGGTGSFLLFLANFLSILLVASIIFFVSGMTEEYTADAKKVVVRSFGLAILGFFILGVFMSHTLFQIMREVKLRRSIRTVLSENLADYPATGIDNVSYHQDAEGYYVLANVQSPSKVTAFKVKDLQAALERQLARPVELVVRSIRTNNVSALGSVGKVAIQSLDGIISTRSPNPVIRKTIAAEQVIRNYLETQTAMQIFDVDYVPLTPPLIAAKISGLRQLRPDEIKELEQKIRSAVRDEAIELAIMHVNMDVNTRLGKMRYGWSLHRFDNTQLRTNKEPIAQAIREKVGSADGFAVVNINIAVMDDTLNFLAEVVGPRVYTREEVRQIEIELREEFEQPIRLYVLSRPEVVVTTDGMLTYEAMAAPFNKRQDKLFQEKLQHLMDEIVD